jgi:hypothetical protein
MLSKPASELSFTRAFPTFGCCVISPTNRIAVAMDSRPYESVLDRRYSRHRQLQHFEMASEPGCSLRRLESLAMVANRKSNFRSAPGVTDLQSKPRLQTGPFGNPLVHPSEVRHKRKFLPKESAHVPHGSSILLFHVLSDGRLRKLPVPLGFSLGDRYQPTDK